jgi:hypothetical protein
MEMETLLKVLTKMDKPRKLYWKDAGFLPVYRCKCGNIQIHNWSELTITKIGRYSRRVERECRDCGLVFSATWWGTHGRSPRRLIDWIGVGFFLMDHLPWKWFQQAKPVILWLERRVPV